MKAVWLVVVAVAVGGCEQPFIPRAGVPTLDDPVTDAFVAVSAGLEHTCALTTAGAAYCWGSNEYDQLGASSDSAPCLKRDRDVACRRLPVAVSGGLTFTRISAGGRHTCALATDNRVYCWGDNLRGALGDPALRREASPRPVVSTDQFTDVVSGGAHSCALRTDGVILCWGANDDGQLGLASVGNGVTVPTPVQTTQRFVSFAAGQRRTCARITDGTTFCWGATWVSRQDGVEVTRPQGSPFRTLQSPSFQALAVGSHTTCGIDADDNAFCWEANPTGAMGDGTTTGSNAPKAVEGATRFVAITSGNLHTCGIADSGLAWCWGSDEFGQLGVPPPSVSSRCSDPAIECSPVPVRVSGWRVFVQLSAGQGDHACGLTLSGSVFCWGAGGLGQRGDGRTSNEWSPTRVRSGLTP